MIHQIPLFTTEEEDKMNDVYIEKVWAMPNSKTFTIKPIKEFVEAEVYRGGGNC